MTWNGINTAVANNSNIINSPSIEYSRKSAPSVVTGYRNKRGSLASMADLCEKTFLPISKYVTLCLTVVPCVLLANMAQMVVLYNVLSEANDDKYILIFFLFPFCCFVCLKINDLNLCNQLGLLFEFGYVNTPHILNRNRQIVHLLGSVGFPSLWVVYVMIHSEWIQSIRIDGGETFGDKATASTINSVFVAIWMAIQFVQFILCTVSLLYCVQHNIQQQRPERNRGNAAMRKYSFSMTNPFRTAAIAMSKGNTAAPSTLQSIAYVQKIQMLERQLASCQNDLIRSKQETMVANSQMNHEYDDEMQEKNQEYRALLAERDLLKQECENKKSLLGLKKTQCKQQQTSIKSLQQIREENLAQISELKKKLSCSWKEVQKMQVLLQIERQNVQKAQEFADYR